MRTKLANWTRLAVVVVVVAGTQTGCKSGWKMPGSDMFSWSRKPSESTLAGSSPSLSMPSGSPSGPVSPAQRNTPSPLASNAANGGRSGSPYGAATSSGPTFNMPPNNPLANTGGAGAVASSNGYTNGPYGMVGNQPRPNGAAAQGGYGAPNSTMANSGYAAPANGYTPNAPGSNPARATGYAPAPNAYAANPSSLPPAYGGLPAGVGGSQAGMGASTYANNPLQTAGYNAGAVNQMPQPLPGPSQPSMPNALPNAYPPSVATQQSNPAVPYRPGSVARPTGYDFSNQGTGGAVANSVPTMSPGMGLPPAVPNTANGTPYGLPNGMNR